MPQTYNDYPKVREQAEHSNDQMVCFFCKTPAAEIQDQLQKHKPDCAYRQKKEQQAS